MPINYNAPIVIRDGRNGNWFWVDKDVWEDEQLTSSDKVVYGTLAFFANSKSQTAFPSITSIHNHSKVSSRQCYLSIKRLEEYKYISVKRIIGKPNSYTLLKTPAKIARVQKQQQGGAKSGVGTPAKYGVRTRIREQDLINKKKRDSKNGEYSSYEDLDDGVMEEISQKYKVPFSFVTFERECLINYVESTGKTYVNYKHALMNFVLRDMKKLAERSKGDKKHRAIDASRV